jgi:hypothetical protein
MTRITQAGFTMTEVPVHHYHRAYGKSQFFNVRRVGRVGIDLIKLWVRLVLLRGLRRRRPATPQAPREA